MKNNDIERILFTESELKARAEQIGKQITADFCGEEVVLVGVLKGAMVFLSDVMRNIGLYCKLDFITVQSYGDGMTSGELKLTRDITTDIKGKNVIVVEDILDTGNTLDYVKRLFLQRQPKTVKICTLLDKKVKKACDIKADYTGFEVDDVFVVGYGLDYAQRYRNLPYIGVLKEEIWK